MARASLSTGLPPKLTLFAMWVSAALAGLCWLTYSGPYRWLAELEMAWFGGYYAFYTWAATFLVLLIPVLGALQISRLLGVVPSVTDAEQHWREMRGRAERRNARIYHYRLPFVLLIAGGTFLFIGGSLWLRALRGKTLESLSVAALESGKRPSSSWLEVNDGQVDWEGSIEWTEDRSTVTYVPMFSASWTEGKPVGVVLVMNEFELETAQGAAQSVFRGASDNFGIPSPIIAAYKDANLDLSRAVVLYVGVVPSEDADMWLWLALGGLAVMLVGLGVGFWKRRIEVT